LHWNFSSSRSGQEEYAKEVEKEEEGDKVISEEIYKKLKSLCELEPGRPSVAALQGGNKDDGIW
jgi:hypothetical protein